mmetsp:Transcript_3961/g.13787  ORF Transcript_3961/g.13787 Transcript_3961/m.13787 type:complete len:202 (+) Transcript_3961:2245-2850(+)
MIPNQPARALRPEPALLAEERHGHLDVVLERELEHVHGLARSQPDLPDQVLDHRPDLPRNAHGQHRRVRDDAPRHLSLREPRAAVRARRRQRVVHRSRVVLRAQEDRRRVFRQRRRHALGVQPQRLSRESHHPGDASLELIRPRVRDRRLRGRDDVAVRAHPAQDAPELGVGASLALGRGLPREPRVRAREDDDAVQERVH